MISKQSAIIILDLLDRKIDKVSEEISMHSKVKDDENLVYRLKDNLESYKIAKDELKREMDRW